MEVVDPLGVGIEDNLGDLVVLFSMTLVELVNQTWGMKTRK